VPENFNLGVLLLFMTSGNGFGWANFDFDFVSGSRNRQKRRDASPRRFLQENQTCTVLQEDLSQWRESFEKGGPVSDFFQRHITCVAILGGIFIIRATCRQFLMWYFPHEPPPPDFAFPGWEGPGKSRDTKRPNVRIWRERTPFLAQAGMYGTCRV
jgi:hypothetical protein